MNYQLSLKYAQRQLVHQHSFLLVILVVHHPYPKLTMPYIIEKVNIIIWSST